MIHLWMLGAQQNEAISLEEMGSLDAVTQRLPGGLYTTFRTYDGGRRVIGVQGHLRRLYEPAGSLGIQPALDERALRQRIASLLQPGIESRVRLVLSSSGDFYIATEPILPLAREIYEQGVAAITLRGHRTAPSLKSTGFIAASQAEREAVHAAGAFEGVLVWNSRILEGLTSNFFYVRGEGVGTAKSGVLPGVTRQTIIRALREADFELVYRALRLKELDRIDAAFLTSSSRGVVPIVKIDGQQIGTGLVGSRTKQLMTLYDATVEKLAEPFV